MIKEYFTDGLIGLAILLSLFQTDLIDLHSNINNLINYPEVQDIIQGQTAVYLPANFHSNRLHAFSHPKLRDREAFDVWYRNVVNSPRFQHSIRNEIEAFLVSGSTQSAIDPSFVNNETSVSSVNNTEVHISSDDVLAHSSQILPQESANSFNEIENIAEGNNSATSSLEQPLSVDVTFLFNNPFPGCNLTREDLGLIELLWKQDVDLGVGKEVYDQSLREELERQRELEYHENQEKLKAQRAALEKESRSKQEEASRWLQQYFTRDGETGEWVKKTDKNNGSAVEEAKEDDFLTLEAALDYISSSVDPSELVFNPEDVPAATTSFSDDLSNLQADSVDTQDYVMPLQQQPMRQSSSDLENEWIEVEQYLNISLREPSSGMGVVPQDLNGVDTIDIKPVMNAAGSGLDVDFPPMMEPNIFTSADLPLLQDATMPSTNIEQVPELGNVSLSNATLPPQPCAMNSSLDWELGNLTFFNNLTVLPEGNVDDMDLQNMESLFNTMTEASELTNITSSDLDCLMMSGGLNDTASMNTSFSGELGDAFDGLEGATGGADFSSQSNLDDPYRKISRLSESSSDSGFGGKGGFSSPSSPSSSSSYAGSPVDSSMSHNSTNSNDTDHDPHGTRALAHQVAHNHTYNTLPGHIPREVKKYAPKESSKKGPQCRDEKRAQELKIPFTIDQIVDSPVETFNDILTKYSLNEEQLSLVRDIRRRGKNKLAAQNCRKRKVGVIVTLSDEMTDLQKVRDRLKAERAEMEKETRKMKEKFGHLYTHIFQSLRDEHGQPYDPNLYSLQQSSDGNVFLVPRNVTTNGVNRTNSSNGNGGGARHNDISRIKKRRSDN